MPEKHAKHSPSQLKYKSSCPNWDNDKDQPTFAADLGTKLHFGMEQYVEYLIGDNEEFDLHAYPAEEQALLAWCMKIVEPYVRQAEETHVECEVHIPEVTWGTCDLILRTGSHLTMMDYKFGQGIIDHPSENYQARAYALGAVHGFKDIETVEFHFLIPKRDAHLQHSWEAKEIFLWFDEFDKIVQKADDPNALNHPSLDTCVYCGNKATCPNVMSTAVEVANRYEGLPLPVEPNLNALTSPEDMGRALQIAAVMERFSRSVKARALEMALDGEQIPGYELKVRKGARKVDDLLAAFAALSPNVLQLEDFLPACKISITELERAVKDVAPRGEKQKFADAVLGDLASAGIVSQSNEIPYLGKTK